MPDAHNSATNLRLPKLNCSSLLSWLLQQFSSLATAKLVPHQKFVSLAVVTSNKIGSLYHRKFCGRSVMSFLPISRKSFAYFVIVEASMVTSYPTRIIRRFSGSSNNFHVQVPTTFLAPSLLPPPLLCS